MARKINLLFLSKIVFYSAVGGQSLACPAVRTSSGWLDLFPLPCKKNSECQVMGNQHLCCKGFCTKGIKASGAIQQQRLVLCTNVFIKPSLTHTPYLIFGTVGNWIDHLSGFALILRTQEPVAYACLEHFISKFIHEKAFKK